MFYYLGRPRCKIWSHHIFHTIIFVILSYIETTIRLLCLGLFHIDLSGEFDMWFGRYEKEDYNLSEKKAMKRQNQQ